MTMGDGMDHLEGGALVRLLDGEGDPADAAHARSCPSCGARLGALERRSLALSTALHDGAAALPAPPADLWDRIVRDARPARPAARLAPAWRRHLPRAAAAAGILLTGALAAQPVARWLSARWGAAPAAETPPASTSGVPVPDGGAAVAFVPTGDELVVRVDRAQPGASLRVVFEERGDASLEPLDEGAAPLGVQPDGFRIRNADAGAGRYLLRVPSSLAAVRVTVAGSPVAVTRPGVPPEGVEVPLGGEG